LFTDTLNVCDGCLTSTNDVDLTQCFENRKKKPSH